MSLWRLLLKEIIAPSFCYYCRTYSKEEIVLCATCVSLIKPIISTKLVLDTHYTMQVHAIAAYEEPLKSLVLAKAWSDRSASKNLGLLMWDYSVLPRMTFDYLIPIPLHKARYASRGYNQCTVIAQELSVLSKKPMNDCLKRIKRTSFQASNKSIDRYKNLEHAFELREGIDFEDKVVVLIDDLMTSGATLMHAGKELIQGRPKEIHAVVACRVM